ncbi:MAG: hypothetical protein Crog4KO_01750 [Crocinitomicaceae bacterium]
MVQEIEVISETKLSNATVRLLPGQIFHIKWKGGIDIEIPDIDELSAAFEQMTLGQKVKVINELDHFTSISNDARKYAAEKSPETIAIAYIIQGLGQRLVLKFYLNIRKRKNPTRVFMKYDEALEWLESL